MLTDFVPIRGLRRKSYLVLSCLLMIGGFLAATLLLLTPALGTVILLVLFFPTTRD